ncbi:MAG: hypothetical protein ABIV10_11160 [Gemmatimonadaceae bacterium]
MAREPATQQVAVLWLSTLQRALGRASHDVKDALNGALVNIEVIRGRAGKPDAPAASIAPFAEAAGQQLDRLTTLIEAILALGRVEREPADVVVTLRRVATICGASASFADAQVTVEVGDLESAATVVPGDAVRLALAAPLLDLVMGEGGKGRASPVRCRVRAGDGTTVVTLEAEGRRAEMPEWAEQAVRAAGVRWVMNERGGVTSRMNDLSLEFPRA